MRFGTTREKSHQTMEILSFNFYSKASKIFASNLDDFHQFLMKLASNVR